MGFSRRPRHLGFYSLSVNNRCATFSSPRVAALRAVFGSLDGSSAEDSGGRGLVNFGRRRALNGEGVLLEHALDLSVRASSRVETPRFVQKLLRQLCSARGVFRGLVKLVSGNPRAVALLHRLDARSFQSSFSASCIGKLTAVCAGSFWASSSELMNSWSLLSSSGQRAGK